MWRAALVLWGGCLAHTGVAQHDPLSARHARITEAYGSGDHKTTIRLIEEQLHSAAGTTWADSLHRYLYKYGHAYHKVEGAKAGIAAAERILALVRAREQADHELEALFDLSWIHYDVGAVDQCARVDSMAVTLADRSPAIPIGQRGRARQYLAFDHSVLGDHRRSLQWALGALDQYRRADTIPAVQWAESYTAAGAACWHLGRIREAEAWYLQARDVLGDAQDIASRERLVSVYGNLGVLWQNAGDPTRARNYYQESLRHSDAIVATTNDPFTKDQAVVARSRTYLNMATVFFQVGDVGRARDLLRLAWDDRSAVLEPDDPQLLALKERMADLELDAGQLENARQLVAAYAQATERRFGRRSEEHVRASIKLGDIVGRLGDHAQADTLFNTAVATRRATPDAATDPLLVQTLERRAAHHLRNRRPQAAHDDLAAARTILVNTYDTLHYKVAAIDVRLAEAAYASGRYAAARDHAARAIAHLADRVRAVRSKGVPTALQDPALLPDAIHWKVRAEHALAQGVFNSAWKEQLDMAILALARNKAALHDPEAKLLLVAAQDRLFHLALDIAYQGRAARGEEATAERFLALSEARRSTLLKERLNAFRGVRFAGVPDTVLAREQELLAALGIDPADRASATAALAHEQAFAAFADRIERTYPAYFALRYGEATITLAQVRQRLLKEGRTLVSYAVTDSALYTLVVGLHEARVVRTPIAGLAEEVRAFNHAIEARNAAEYPVHAHRLYQRLLAPVEPYLRGAELLIVPDGPLHQVSFDALLVRPADATSFIPHLLVQHRTIAYLLSATTAVQFADLARKADGAALALAPGFTGDVKRRYMAQVKDTASIDKHFLTYVRQPFAVRSAQALGPLLGARVRIGSEASEGCFRREAAGHGILHLGTHAEMNATDPMYARLVFSKDGEGLDPDADGYLHAYEIYELDLRAQLAVLTACETGAGRTDGEGVRSLGHGFAYAGCPSLVMALWNIDEKVTAEVIERFYEHLADGMPKHEALRRAKLDHLERASDELAMPYYWAGLVLVGDVDPVQRPFWHRHRWWVLAALVLVVVGAAVWWRRR